MVVLFQNIIRKFKTKSYRFSIYEVALFGLMLALFIMGTLLEQYVFIGKFRISVTYPIFIVFGLSLGPWRGAFLGILCNTITASINGIGTWMIEYAIIPPLIAFISGWFTRMFFLNNKYTWWSGFIFISLAIILFITIFSFYQNIIIDESDKRITRLWPIKTVLGIGSGGLLFILIGSILLGVKNARTRNFKTKLNTTLLFAILLIVTFVLIMSRWLWGPFAFINYYNRFRNGNWKYEDYYLLIMIPIIIKSFIEIPIYALIIFAIYPIIVMIRQKIHFHRNLNYLN
ncbi:ECF transporter S component [[Mycoplasma] phocae]|uniref:ECF transporter S component n=1 Tax=[Mycoplasma] phocae TaxID=142651 RepID=A0A2Z5IQK3_9BACT|nr:ECF transporter S component [[Mycoplasma] phocae]AXE60990.1 ECF transporter S component [[Mycoplasma] phocae]